MKNDWQKIIVPLMLHSSIHDDEPCQCIECLNLREVIRRNAETANFCDNEAA